MQQYAIGERIPDFEVTDSEGHLRPLSQQVGERGVLVFALRGTWCAFCVDQIRTVRRNYKAYRELGFNTVFISPEAEDAVWTFKISQAQPLPFALHADPKKSTIEFFLPSASVGVHPAAYLLDENLEVKWAYIGVGEEDRPSHSVLTEAMQGYLGKMPA